MSAPLPRCQNPNCKREMQLAGEDEHSHQFICLRCLCVRVQTKPRAMSAAKAELTRRKHAEAEERLRRLRARPKYFFLQGALK